MNQTKLFDIRMSDVSETSLLTLYCHALESQSSDPIIRDPKAVEIMRAMNQELSKSKNRLDRSDEINSYSPAGENQSLEESLATTS